MIRLVLSDIDGTLLPFGDEAISRDIHDAIAALRAEGIGFCPASGRTPFDMTRVFKDTSVMSTCIATDGHMVIHDGKAIVLNTYPHDDLKRLAKRMRSYEKGVMAICFNVDDNPLGFMTWVGISPSQGGDAIAKKHFKDLSHVPVLDDIPDRDIYSVVIFANFDNEGFDDVHAMAEESCEGIHVLNSSPGIFDVCINGCDKAQGALALLDSLHLTSEEVVFFGDSNNDIPLFELFENSFCVACGSKRAKESARWVIPNPADGGPSVVMHALAKNKGNLEAALEELGL